jgi:hypothetical protein
MGGPWPGAEGIKRRVLSKIFGLDLVDISPHEIVGIPAGVEELVGVQADTQELGDEDVLGIGKAAELGGSGVDLLIP